MAQMIPNKVKLVHPGDPFNHELHLDDGISTKRIPGDIQDLMNNWTVEQIVDSYSQRHPEADKDKLLELLYQVPNYVHYIGSDLIYARNNETKEKEFLLIEINTNAGGHASIPPSSRVYENHLRASFFGREKDWKFGKEEGGLAFLYGSNKLVTPNYPHFMAEMSGENVYAVPLTSMYNAHAILNGEIIQGDEQLIKFIDGVMFVKYEEEWRPIRACLRRQSAKPWCFVPVRTKTCMHPPSLGCLAGGKNKILAQLAFERFNQKYEELGLQISTPRTIIGVEKNNAKSIIEAQFPSGRAVVKSPYGASGLGVYIIRAEADIHEFLASYQYNYSLFVVQELIGAEQEEKHELNNDKYSFAGYEGENGDKYAYSLRCLICHSGEAGGFKLIGLRGARAPSPFRKTKEIYQAPNADDRVQANRDVYITNIGSTAEMSIHADEESARRMGYEFHDVVDGFVQTILAMLALDELCAKLMKNTKEGDTELDLELLKILNPDPQFISEVMTGNL